MRQVQRTVYAGVLKVVISYAVVAGAWILLSDRAMGLLVQDPKALVRASIAKGWFFVAVTALLLYILVRRFAVALVGAHERELTLERERRQPPPMLVAIADASTDAIYAKDEEGRYVLFSNAAARIVGKSATEVIGRDDRACFPGEQAEEIMSIDRRIRSTGGTESREETLKTVEGERVFLAIKGPLRDADGRIFGTYGISRDITGRKHAERMLHESQMRLRLLVEHSPVALAMFDKDMRYLEASPRWRSEYGGGEADIIGRSHYEIQADLPDAWKAVHARGLAGETLRSEEDRYQHVDGRVIWVRWEVRPWLTDAGAIGGIVIYAEDISRRKEDELQLRSHNQALERFNRAAIERELRMVALKQEVNRLASDLGRTAPYDISFADSTEARVPS